MTGRVLWWGPVLTRMRAKDPGEGFLTAYVLRPLVWAAFQFSGEARMLRRSR